MDALGKLICFEGCDGVGKTTLAEEVLAELLRRGVRVKYISFPGRNPETLGRLVYDIHHDKLPIRTPSITPLALQTLHLAAHFDTIETTIKPLLNQGYLLLLDRCWWSTLVYGKVYGGNEIILENLVRVEQSLLEPHKPAAVLLVLRESKNHQSSILQAEYLRVAKNEELRYPVHYVYNNSDVKAARDMILSVLPGDIS